MMMRPQTKLAMLSLLAALGILAQGAVQAAEITVLAGMGNVSGIQDLAPAFERASGHKVIVRFVATADLPGVIEANTPADVLTAGPQAIDDYIAKGKVVAGTRLDFGKAGADYVGPLPGELQDYVLFSTGVLAVSKQVDAAKAFQKFAAASESAALLRKSGMEPWHGGR